MSNQIIEIIDNKPYIINCRKKGELRIDSCYFCGRKHEHGRGEGHRVAHCLSKDVNQSYNHNGTIITFQSGYIVKDY